MERAVNKMQTIFIQNDHRDPTFRALDSQNSAWRAKINFFFTNIFWTHETDFANCLYSNASPEFNFFSKRRFVPWAFRDKDNVSVKQKSL